MMLIDDQDRLLHQAKGQGPESTLLVPNLAAGGFLLRVTTRYRQFTEQIIVH